VSLTVIKEEIERFLSSSTPEVICIRGKWGVGKTYGWQKFLQDAKNNNKLAKTSYAYVSLFGLNSIDDLRYAIFESTVTGNSIGKDPNTVTLGQLVKNRDIARKHKTLTEFAAAVFNRKAVADLIAKSAFLTVRDQLICLDDLERTGHGLQI